MGPYKRNTTTNDMDKLRLKRVTNKYNAERNNYSFPTMVLSYDQVRSIIDIHPGWENLDDDILVYRIAAYLNYSAFSWN